MPATSGICKQQREADRAAEEFGEVGRHRRHFADDPQGPDDRLRKMLAAHFGQIAPGDDAELGRQRLEQHGDDIGEQHDPQQRIAVFRARLDVGGEIAGVHIGDRGDHRRAGEQQRAEPARLAGQHLANALRRSDPSCPVAPRASLIGPRTSSRMSHASTEEYIHCYAIVNRLRNGAKAGRGSPRQNAGCTLQPWLHSDNGERHCVAAVSIAAAKSERGRLGDQEARQAGGRPKTRESRPSPRRPTLQQGALGALGRRCSKTIPN